MRTLLELRDAIDSVDRQLLQLLNDRAELAHEVGELKKLDGSPVFRPEREAAVINKLQSINQRGNNPGRADGPRSNTPQ